MTYAVGTSTVYAHKRQTGLGVPATGGSAQQYRRDELLLKFDKTKIQNNEIRSDGQQSMSRLGLGMGDAQWKGPISPGVQSSFWDALTRSTYQSAVTSGAIINVAAVATAPHFIIAAGSFLTMGFVEGLTFRCTGWTTIATGNNNRNFLVTAVTALTMTVVATDGLPVVAKAAGDSVTMAAPGKYCFTPSTGWNDIYTTLESWQPDVDTAGQSHVLTDARIVNSTFTLAPNGLFAGTVAYKALAQVRQQTQYFTAPTAAASTAVCATGSGAILANGVKIGYLTSANVNVNLASDVPPVVCSTQYPFIGTPQIQVSGSLALLWLDNTFDDAYLAEANLSLVFLVQNGPAANADFVSVIIPRVHLFTSDPDDGVKVRTRKYNFDAAENSAGTVGKLISAIAIQDSLAP